MNCRKGANKTTENENVFLYDADNDVKQTFLHAHHNRKYCAREKNRIENEQALHLHTHTNIHYARIRVKPFSCDGNLRIKY